MKIKAILYSASRAESAPFGDLAGRDVRVLRDYHSRGGWCVRGGVVDGSIWGALPGTYLPGGLPKRVYQAHHAAHVDSAGSWVPAGAVTVRGLSLPWRVMGLVYVYQSPARLWADTSARAWMGCALVVPGAVGAMSISGVLVSDDRGRLGLLLGRYSRLPLVRSFPVVF